MLMQCFIKFCGGRKIGGNQLGCGGIYIENRQESRDLTAFCLNLNCFTDILSVCHSFDSVEVWHIDLTLVHVLNERFFVVTNDVPSKAYTPVLQYSYFVLMLTFVLLPFYN